MPSAQKVPAEFMFSSLFEICWGKQAKCPFMTISVPPTHWRRSPPRYFSTTRRHMQPSWTNCGPICIRMRLNAADGSWNSDKWLPFGYVRGSVWRRRSSWPAAWHVGGARGTILCTDSKIVRTWRVRLTGGRPIKARGVTVQEVKPANYVPQGPAYKIKCLGFFFFFLLTTAITWSNFSQASRTTWCEQGCKTL